MNLQIQNDWFRLQNNGEWPFRNILNLSLSITDRSYYLNILLFINRIPYKLISEAAIKTSYTWKYYNKFTSTNTEQCRALYALSHTRSLKSTRFLRKRKLVHMYYFTVMVSQHSNKDPSSDEVPLVFINSFFATSS